MNDNTAIFQTVSLSDAQRAADVLRDEGVEALLRSDWGGDPMGAEVNDMSYFVMVPRHTSDGAVQLLESQELHGELKPKPAVGSLSAVENAAGAKVAKLLLIGVAIAAGVWLVVRSL